MIDDENDTAKSLNQLLTIMRRRNAKLRREARALRGKVFMFEQIRDRSWQDHRILAKDPRPTLPLPRVELAWTRIAPRSSTCVLRLVLSRFYPGHVQLVPIVGVTTNPSLIDQATEGARWPELSDGRLYLPYGLTAEIKHTQETIPFASVIYGVCRKKVWTILSPTEIVRLERC